MNDSPLVAVVDDDGSEFAVAGVVRLDPSGIRVAAAWRIAAEENLVIRADRQSLRSGAVVMVDREHTVDIQSQGVDDRNAAGHRVVAIAVDLRNGDEELVAPRIISALLDTVRGFF